MNPALLGAFLIRIGIKWETFARGETFAPRETFALELTFFQGDFAKIIFLDRTERVVHITDRSGVEVQYYFLREEAESRCQAAGGTVLHTEWQAGGSERAGAEGSGRRDTGCCRQFASRRTTLLR